MITLTANQHNKGVRFIFAEEGWSVTLDVGAITQGKVKRLVMDTFQITMTEPEAYTPMDILGKIDASTQKFVVVGKFTKALEVVLEYIHTVVNEVYASVLESKL